MPTDNSDWHNVVTSSMYSRKIRKDIRKRHSCGRYRYLSGKMRLSFGPFWGSI